eukprot:scaffold231099_cov15-Tisochrysis_lutea.AAC.1
MGNLGVMTSTGQSTRRGCSTERCQPILNRSFDCHALHMLAGIVFLLWGKPAQAKEKLIPAARHHVLKCPHPSPLASASGPGFSGCRHFSQANNLLVKSGLPPVDWSLE